LALAGKLAWQHVYEGDPLWIHAGLTSPRAQQLFNQAARRREKNLPVETGAFEMPDIPPEKWASTITIRVAKVDERGQSVPVFGADANPFRVPRHDEDSPMGERLPILVADWMLPAAVCAGLKPGKYAIEIAWLGATIVDQRLLDANGRLLAEALRFEVTAPANAIERAEHLDHLAQYEFFQGNQARARALGEEALRMDPESFGPERADTYLLVAQAALAMNDRPAAAATYRALLAKLPPPNQNDMAVYVSEALAKLE